MSELVGPLTTLCATHAPLLIMNAPTGEVVWLELPHIHAHPTIPVRRQDEESPYSAVEQLSVWEVGESPTGLHLQLALSGRGQAPAWHAEW